MKQSEPNKRDKGYAWHTAIGLQAVDGLKTSKYLIDTAIKNIEGDISIDEAQELLNTYYEENPKRKISVSIKVNIERVLMPFAKMPKTNRRTDILPNLVAVFRIILYYKSVTKYRRTRHTFTKSNGLYAMS